MKHAKKLFLADSRFDLSNESKHHSSIDYVISSIVPFWIQIYLKEKNKFNTTKLCNVIEPI